MLSSIGDLASAQAREIEIMIDHILRVVAQNFDVSVDDIKSQRRNRQVLPARHIAAYLAQTASGMTPHEIGDRLGGRDHTNIVMYCRTVARRIQEDEEFRRLVDDLEARVRLRTELS